MLLKLQQLQLIEISAVVFFCLFVFFYLVEIKIIECQKAITLS